MLKNNNKSVIKVCHNQTTIKMIYMNNNVVFEYSELPQGYQRCKYVRTASGGNYINTGFIPNNYDGNYALELDIQGVEIPSSSRYMCGTGSPRSCNIRVNTSGSITIYNQSTSGSSAATALTMRPEEIDILNRIKFKVILRDESTTTLIKDGVEHTGTTVSKTDSTNAYRIGQTTGSNGYDTKIYGAKIYDINNNLVRNFIPCLDTNDVPCFYDSVNKQTYYNRGTGTFDYELESNSKLITKDNLVFKTTDNNNFIVKENN